MGAGRRGQPCRPCPSNICARLWVVASSSGSVVDPFSNGPCSAPPVREVLEVLMTTGTIKKVVADRGFGFITAEDARNTSSIAAASTPRSTLIASSAASESSSRSSRAPKARGRTRCDPPSVPGPPHRRADASEAGPRSSSVGTCLARPPSWTIRNAPRRSSGAHSTTPRGVTPSFALPSSPVSATTLRNCRLHQRPRGQHQQPRGRRPSSARAADVDVSDRGPPSDPQGRARRLPSHCRGPEQVRRRRFNPARVRDLGRRDGARVLDFVRALGPFGHHASHRPAAPDTRSAGRPLRARGQDRRHRHHVAIRGQSPDERIRCRPKPSPRHPARRARTPIRRSRHGQASIGPGGSQGHPELRPAWSGQGIRTRARRVARRGRGASIGAVRRGRWPTRTSSAAKARRTARAWSKQWQVGLGSCRFVDRYVGRAELRKWLEAADVFVTLSQPRSDRVRDHVLRDGRRPRHRVHAIRLRD